MSEDKGPPRSGVGSGVRGGMSNAVILVLTAMGAIAVALILVGVGTADAVTLGIVSLASLLVPCLFGFIAVRGGMPVTDALSWAVPSWLCLAAALTFPVLPASVVLFVVGIGVPTLMLFSPSARSLWYRYILRIPNQQP